MLGLQFEPNNAVSAGSIARAWLLTLFMQDLEAFLKEVDDAQEKMDNASENGKLVEA
jgi:hypothetical protein